MKAFILTIVALTQIVCSSAAFAHTSAFQRAVNTLQLGNIQRAYDQFEMIPAESPDFVAALVELQKLHYRFEKWDRLFAYAVFYREKLLKTPQSQNKYFNSRMLSIEAASLIKHCLYKEASIVSRLGMKISERLQIQDTHEFQKALHFSRMSGNVTGLSHDNQDVPTGSAFFTDRFFWPLHTETVSQVKHPRILRFQVKNACTKKETASIK